MKIMEILKAEKHATDEELKNFIYKNFSQEMIIGLEYDDPKTIKRALKLFGINYKEEKKEELST